MTSRNILQQIQLSLFLRNRVEIGRHMASNEIRQWHAWSEDRQVSYACWDGGLQVRVADGGKSKRSDWCKLIGNNVDVTIRRLLNELGYKKDAG